MNCNWYIMMVWAVMLGSVVQAMSENKNLQPDEFYEVCSACVGGSTGLCHPGFGQQQGPGT